MMIRPLRGCVPLLLLLSNSIGPHADPQPPVPEDTLAATLAEIPTDNERNARLAGEPKLLSPALVRGLLQQGARLYEEGNSARALAINRLALSVAEKLKDQERLADALFSVGRSLSRQDKDQEALELFQRSLELSKQRGYTSGTAKALVEMGRISLKQKHSARALELEQQSLALAEKAGDRATAAMALNGIGLIYLEGVSYTRALESFQKSLKLGEELKDQFWIAGISQNIADTHYWLGNYAQALAYYQSILTLAEKSGKRALLSSQLNNAAMVYMAQGDYLRALDYLKRCLELMVAMEEKRGIVGALGNIAELYYLQADYPQAMIYYRKCLKLSQELGHHAGISGCMLEMGNVYLAQKQYLSASQSYQGAIRVFERFGSDQVGIANALDSLGRLYSSQDKCAEALPYYQRSLSLHQQAGHSKGTVAALQHLADCHYSLGNPARAVELSKQALATAKKLGPSWTSETLEILGKSYLALGKLDFARESFGEAIEIIEQLRHQVAGGEAERPLFFEKRTGPYYGMVNLLLREHLVPEALVFAERSKSRVLLDVLQQGRVNVTKAMTPQEQDQEEKLRSEIVSLNSQLSKEEGEERPRRLSTLQNQLQEARLEFESFQTNLYAAHPELRTQRGEVSPPSFAEMKALLGNGNRAVLEFVVGEEKSYLFVLIRDQPRFAPEPTVTLKVYPLDLKSRQLTMLIEDFRRRLADPSLPFRPLARRLYRELLEPVSEQLRGISELCIIPDRSLWELPFQALLVNENKYLLEDFAISYAPSLAVLREMMKPRRGPATASIDSRWLLALGNPALGKQRLGQIRNEAFLPLPETAREVEALGELYGASHSTVYVDLQANEETVKAEAASYRVIHFATHGWLDNQSPLYSHLVLAQPDQASREDGLLEAWEVMKLDLRAELVVLSACQTARGKVRAGEGVIGMSWAFFVAGVPTTVVSQWKVDSASTTVLMVEFHRNLRLGSSGTEPRISSSEALRRAELKVSKSPRFRHPFYWAGFVVTGRGA